MKGVIPTIAAVCGLAAAGAVLVFTPPTLDAAVASGMRAPPADLNVRVGGTPTAAADLERHVQGMRRNDLFAWRSLGELYRVRGEQRKAEAAWRRSARLADALLREPDFADNSRLWFCLGWCRWRLGEEGSAEAMRRAEQLFQERIGARRAAAQLWANVGYCRAARGEPAGAADAWNQALEAFRRVNGDAPQGGAESYDLACHLALTGDKDGALRALTRAADAGWRDGIAEWDPDLELLRGDTAFDAALGRILGAPPEPAG